MTFCTLSTRKVHHTVQCCIVRNNVNQFTANACLLNLLYADDLILMAESEESLRDKIVKWKSGLEAKGLKMNTGKMKVMFSCSMKGMLEYSFPRLFVPWNIRSLDRSFHGTFVPWTIRSLELSFRDRSFPGPFVPETEYYAENSFPNSVCAYC